MEPLVTIAIPDLDGPAARSATLASLAHHTPESHQLVLLVEETGQSKELVEREQAGRAEASPTPTLHRFSVPAPFGVPIALNALLGVCTTPYILLLESGTIVTSGWLGRLLAAMSDPAVGLSGPSTNISWNEQQVLSGSGGTGWSVQKIEEYAASIATRYCNVQHSLDTLHSLGDFCYLFKRSVAEQLGGFDEAYGAGPCWEIDFNTRAARAGFRAVWVSDAYVHRVPAPPARAQAIRRLFTINKQLYQDRFCGLRLQGEKKSYEVHCRGEACEHFAPQALIRITLTRSTPLTPAPPLPASEPFSLLESRAGGERQGPATGIQRVSGRELETVGEHSSTPLERYGDHTCHDAGDHSAISLSTTNDLPLISCIMPTCNRRAFIRQALAYFERQDYPNLELIVVDDGEDKVADLMPADPRVRYIALPERTSIGAKRNLACEKAHGAIIAHWDDDDWYASHRLQHQVAPLLDKKVDITGLETSCFFDLTLWQAWTCTPELHSRLFIGDVHGGTLVYWRWVWERLARYPARSVAEDALFLRQATQRGARLHKLPHASSFVYVRHGSNAWNFPLGSYLHPAGWTRCELTAFLPSTDLPFYATFSAAAPEAQHPQAARPPESHEKYRGARYGCHDESGFLSELPLVSCIMPTYNRRQYVPQAISYFLRQDYPNRELIILDDGSQPVGDLVPSDPRIRYVHLDTRVILGAKRNLACELAQGTIIAHWDDDDWIAPHRLRYQVEMLEREKADLCGAGRQLYYNPATRQAWLYEYPASIRRWLAGNTLCYRKAFWAKNLFPEIAVGEDTRFTWSPNAKNAVVVPDHTFYVGLVHSANTGRKAVTGPYWRPHPVEEIHRLLGADLTFYHSIGMETSRMQIFSESNR